MELLLWLGLRHGRSGLHGNLDDVCKHVVALGLEFCCREEKAIDDRLEAVGKVLGRRGVEQLGDLRKKLSRLQSPKDEVVDSLLDLAEDALLVCKLLVLVEECPEGLKPGDAGDER